ncbi:putative SCF ubiquitin ligase [Aureococcus anophagefferens virus]|uniref:Putative SCF ubiquitin ligase n=1 Tax=Aureococcus anophagefferens virus TaxID=1474867 RepID=A0A076FGF1_9VIRU|nr:putative SCF ubiquitin ligase [Aureococcus anophagefferens virus]AII17155.1 putative SCF ubiquitin ligase [Aureococcus anophagefferens virus]UOG94267.1 hypothetical protein MKD35_232 [Aureococcus anophagefferens virus]
MVKIITNDNVEIDVQNEMATFKISDKESLIGLFSNFIDNDDDDDDVRVDVSSIMIKNVIDYCKLYVDNKMKIPEKPLLSYDMKDNVQKPFAEFINKFSTLEVLQLILTADYLQVKPLLSLAGSKIGSLIKGKTSKEINEKTLKWLTETPIEKLAVELDMLVASEKVQDINI